MDESTEYPWPIEGDDPLALDDDWRLNAAVNWDRGEPWFPIARGFRLIADGAVARLEEKRAHVDFLVYPILANYRHYIEVSLKGLIRDARRLLDEQGTAPHGHNLLNLWNTARPLLLRIAPEAKADLDNVGATIERFSRVAPTAEAGRYPVDTEGNAPIPEEITLINLGRMRDVVGRLDGFFDACAMDISVRLDYKYDAEEEWRSVQAEMSREMLAEFGDGS
ncbi:MAG TPA: hypothetical protein VF063_10580 [Gaiellaceae bacterium]